MTPRSVATSALSTRDARIATTHNMLEYVDRLQLAVHERGPAAERFATLLDAAVTAEDAVAPLAATRTTVRTGAVVVELLQPDGTGPVATHLERWGPGLFAAGFAVRNMTALRSHLLIRRVSFAEADGQLFLDPGATGDHGLRCVVSTSTRDRPLPGLLTGLYEVTNLVRHYGETAAGYADVFGLATERYCDIESAPYGYRGVLTMFAPDDRLDRIECITPHDTSKTMGRFMHKHGESLYMAFAEAPDLAPIRSRLERECPHDWTGVPGPSGLDTIFVHPKALAGLLLGISRTSVAWSWSGQPDRTVAGP